LFERERLVSISNSIDFIVRSLRCTVNVGFTGKQAFLLKRQFAISLIKMHNKIGNSDVINKCPSVYIGFGFVSFAIVHRSQIPSQ
jgi:hypothetical protein